MKKTETFFLILLCGALAGNGEGGERFRYANRPDAVMPFSEVTIYKDFFATVPEFLGMGREKPEPEVKTVKIGFIGPLLEEDGPLLPAGLRPFLRPGATTVFGRSLLQGATLALEEANREGGYRGKDFELVRRTDLVQWGQTSNELARFAYEDQVWAVLSSLDSNHNHVLSRATLKTHLPVVNAGSTDPTLTEHTIPWLVRCINDDRLNTYELMSYIYQVRKHTRVALLRVNDRDGRLGVAEFIKGARRLGHPVLMELRFQNGDTDFRDQLERIRELQVQTLVLWANPPEAALILKQMRRMGLRQEVAGFDRLAHPLFLEAAAEAAEGVVVASTFNPQLDHPFWQGFRKRYLARFDQEPDAYAAHGYDGMSILLQAIRRAGLNRVCIRDALYSLQTFPGVTGEIVFDQTMNDISRPWLAAAKEGTFHYFRPPDWERKKRLPVVIAAQPSPSSSRIKIGLLIPTRDRLASEGRGVENAARLALAEANARDQDHRFELSIAPSDLPWGAQTSELVRLIYAEKVPVIIGGLDSRSAHLAAQVVTRAKGQALLLTLASDATLTQMGIPWVFRIGPGDAAQAPVSPACLQLRESFQRRYRARYQEPPTITAAYAYDAVRITLEAMGSAGIEPANILRLLSGERYLGVTGLIQFDKSGNRIGLSGGNRSLDPSP